MTGINHIGGALSPKWNVLTENTQGCDTHATTTNTEEGANGIAEATASNEPGARLNVAIEPKASALCVWCDDGT